MPEQFTGLVEIQTGAELTTIRLEGDNARVLVGENGESGGVSVRTGAGEERGVDRPVSPVRERNDSRRRKAG